MEKAMVRTFLFCALALSLAACATTRPIGEGNSSMQVVGGNLPDPTPGDQLSQGRPYLVGPFDRLRIDVFGVAELSNRIVQADASGRFSFPLAGQIDAVGLTPAEVEGRIESQLAGRYVRNPDVTVNVEQSANSNFTIEGQVIQPGIYPVVTRMSLLRAIATARGVSEFARLEEVIVFRTVNGQRFAGAYNLSAIRRGAYDDPEIFTNDVIVVGDSPRRRIFRDILSVAPLLSTPLIILFQN
jgi:polysaccharide biosynthesis/export protein